MSTLDREDILGTKARVTRKDAQLAEPVSEIDEGAFDKAFRSESIRHYLDQDAVDRRRVARDMRANASDESVMDDDAEPQLLQPEEAPPEGSASVASVRDKFPGDPPRPVLVVPPVDEAAEFLQKVRAADVVPVSASPAQLKVLSREVRRQQLENELRALDAEPEAPEPAFIEVTSVDDFFAGVDRTMSILTDKPKSADHGTPDYILDAVREVFSGGIDLDPAGHIDFPTGAKLTYYGPSFRDGIDGLSGEWMGKIFLNAPHGKLLGNWVAKALEEIERFEETSVLQLLPARTDTSYGQRVLKTADIICLPDHRLKYKGNAHPAPFTSMLALWGTAEEVERFYHAFAVETYHRPKRGKPRPIGFCCKAKDFLLLQEEIRRRQEVAIIPASVAVAGGK